MTDDDFEDALARALHGELMTDAGASPGLLTALARVAAAATPAERRPAMRAARRLHEQESGAPAGPRDDEPAGEADGWAGRGAAAWDDLHPLDDPVDPGASAWDSPDAWDELRRPGEPG